jgi:dihydrofolate reductase
MLKSLHIIAACSENRVIGRGGRLPWRIPEDFAFLQKKTLGQTVILGRICFQGWPGAAKGRHPIVVTSNLDLATEDVTVASSFSNALAIADERPEEIYICGGQRIYEEALTLALKPARPIRLLLTLVHTEIADGDRFFPEWRQLAWRELSRRESVDANYRYTFLELERG